MGGEDIHFHLVACEEFRATGENPAQGLILASKDSVGNHTWTDEIPALTLTTAFTFSASGNEGDVMTRGAGGAVTWQVAPGGDENPEYTTITVSGVSTLEGAVVVGPGNNEGVIKPNGVHSLVVEGGDGNSIDLDSAGDVIVNAKTGKVVYIKVNEETQAGVTESHFHMHKELQVDGESKLEGPVVVGPGNNEGVIKPNGVHSLVVEGGDGNSIDLDSAGDVFVKAKTGKEVQLNIAGNLVAAFSGTTATIKENVVAEKNVQAATMVVTGTTHLQGVPRFDAVADGHSIQAGYVWTAQGPNGAGAWGPRTDVTEEMTNLTVTGDFEYTGGNPQAGALLESDSNGKLTYTLEPHVSKVTAEELKLANADVVPVSAAFEPELGWYNQWVSAPMKVRLDDDSTILELSGLFDSRLFLQRIGRMVYLALNIPLVVGGNPNGSKTLELMNANDTVLQLPDLLGSDLSGTAEEVLGPVIYRDAYALGSANYYQAAVRLTFDSGLIIQHLDDVSRSTGFSGEDSYFSFNLSWARLED